MTPSPDETVLLTGGTGQLGWQLRRSLTPLGTVCAPGRAELDLARADTIRRCVREIGPSLIVNAAAYTAVDGAEEDAELALAVNGRAPGVLAEEARRLGVPLLHYSTDAVFDGEPAPNGTRRPYVESDPPHPLNVYGATKLEGERAIRDAGGDHLILRVSWVYDLRGRNFLRAIQSKAEGGGELPVVDDQIGSPTWAWMLAEATAAILIRSQGRAGSRFGRDLFHLSGPGETSWYGFAAAILERTGRAEHARLVPVPTSAYPFKAKRSAYSVLDSSALGRAFGVGLPDWETQLRLCLET